MWSDFVRLAGITVTCAVLVSCGREGEPDNVEQDSAPRAEEVSVGEEANAVEPPASASRLPPTTPPPPEQRELDLSVPQDDPESAEKYFSGNVDERRYQLDDVFEKSKEEEKRLKFKSKLHVKEGATMEQAMDNYADSIDGAEMGFEYKTK